MHILKASWFPVPGEAHMIGIVVAKTSEGATQAFIGAAVGRGGLDEAVAIARSGAHFPITAARQLPDMLSSIEVD
jgi:hypothetical protein